MKKRRRIEFTTFTQKSFTIRKPGGVSLAWCTLCDSEVKMVTLDEASIIAGVNWRTINHWVEAGKIHITETPEGLLQICLESLLHYA